jgi:hypothetical protein
MAIIDCLRHSFAICLGTNIGLNKFRVYRIIDEYTDDFFSDTDGYNDGYSDGYSETEILVNGNYPYVKETFSTNILGGIDFDEMEIVLPKPYSTSLGSGGYDSTYFKINSSINKTEIYIKIIDIETNEYSFYDIKDIDSKNKMKIVLKLKKRF